MECESYDLKNEINNNVYCGYKFTTFLNKANKNVLNLYTCLNIKWIINQYFHCLFWMDDNYVIFHSAPQVNHFCEYAVWFVWLLSSIALTRNEWYVPLAICLGWFHSNDFKRQIITFMCYKMCTFALYTKHMDGWNEFVIRIFMGLNWVEGLKES